MVRYCLGDKVSVHAYEFDGPWTGRHRPLKTRYSYKRFGAKWRTERIEGTVIESLGNGAYTVEFINNPGEEEQPEQEQYRFTTKDLQLVTKAAQKHKRQSPRDAARVPHVLTIFPPEEEGSEEEAEEETNPESSAAEDLEWKQQEVTVDQRKELHPEQTQYGPKLKKGPQSPSEWASFSVLQMFLLLFPFDGCCTEWCDAWNQAGELKYGESWVEVTPGRVLLWLGIWVAMLVRSKKSRPEYRRQDTGLFTGALFKCIGQI